MPEPSFHTTNLRCWIHRLQAGDGAARDELLRLAPANHGLPALEAELARLDRAQLLEALGTPP